MKEPKKQLTVLDTPLPKTFAQAEKEMEDWMMAHPREVIAQRMTFLEKLNKKRCSYGEGTTLPITLTPLFLKDSSQKLIANVAEVLERALDKTIDAYRTDEKVRSYFPYTDLPKEWIEWDPGYKKPTIINRHDALFDGTNLKFIEFNTDNPGGRGWTGVYEQLFMNQEFCSELMKTWVNPDRPHMLRMFLDAHLNCYKEYGGKKEKPRIGLASFKRYLVGSDAEIVRDYCIEQGYESHFVDPRELEYHDNALWSNGVQFDIINMSLRFVFFKRYPREMKEFLAAMRDRAMCTVNPFRALIGSHKEIMALMTNEDMHYLYNEEEREYIKKYVPWTRKLDETITLSPEGVDISMHEYLLKNKDKVVLKPTGGAGGQDVYVGKITDYAKWEAVVDHCMGCSWWIAQEVMEIPEYEFPILKDGKVIKEKRNLNINPYIFNGKYAGMLGRISSSKVVNVSSGGGIIPIFPLKPGS